MEIVNLQDGFVTYLYMYKSIRVGLYSYLIWSKLIQSVLSVNSAYLIIEVNYVGD